MKQLPSRIAVLGAGPIGLEIALYARNLGFPTTVYESGGEVATHVRAWGHVQLFTPWSLDVSVLGERRLRETDAWSPGPSMETNPTGEELIENYLLPLSRLPELRGVVRTHHRVTDIGRCGLLKGEAIAATGDGRRSGRAFTLLVKIPEGEVIEEADIVIDATGVFGQPNWIGASGIPAAGERDSGDHFLYGVPDVSGRDRARIEGKDVMLVGNGFSSATTVTALTQLPVRSITWVTLNQAPPIEEIDEDPLPARLQLTREANRLASEPPQSLRHIGGGSIARLRPAGHRVAVELRQNATGSGETTGETTGETIEVDTIIAQTGFHPDNQLYRELQFHECYASQGPMKLASAHLGASGGDCMVQSGHGPDSLSNPEPGFFVIGSKSYGRNSQFLLRIGREQVRDLFRLITDDPDLDLYARSPGGTRSGATKTGASQ